LAATIWGCQTQMGHYLSFFHSFSVLIFNTKLMYTKVQKAGGVAEMAEHLPSEPETPSTNTNIPKK
jgi:hypothetical protein